jgi:hypothetical protein
MQSLLGYWYAMSYVMVTIGTMSGLKLTVGRSRRAAITQRARHVSRQSSGRHHAHLLPQAVPQGHGLMKKKRSAPTTFKSSERRFYLASRTPHVMRAANGIEPNALATSAAIKGRQQVSKGMSVMPSRRANSADGRGSRATSFHGGFMRHERQEGTTGKG